MPTDPNNHPGDAKAEGHDKEAASHPQPHIWHTAWNWLRERDAEKLTAWSTLVVAIATLALAVVTCSTDQTTRSVLVTSNRAWIAVRGISLDAPLKAGEDKPIKIYYINSGHSPALFMKEKFYITTIQNPVKEAPFYTIDQDICDEITIDKSGASIFPGLVEEQWASTRIPGRYITDRVINNIDALLLNGCFKYQTMGETHRTRLCFSVYENDILASRNRSTPCANENWAD